jgi:hypothetical protein
MTEVTIATRTSASPLSYKVIDPSIVWDFNDLRDGRRVPSWASKLLDRRQSYYFHQSQHLGRTKIKTLSTFTRHLHWRLFAPEMGVGDMAV